MSILVHIKVDDKGNAKVVELGKNTEKLKDKTNQLDKTMKAVFTAGAVLYGIHMLRDGLSGTVDEVLKFESAIKKIKGIGEITGSSLASVSKQARSLSLDTEFAASKIAGSMLELVKQGFQDPEALLGAMPKILDLATSATMELDYAAANTIATLRAFNLENHEVGRVANVIATGLNKTAMGAEDYMEAMKYVAPVAASVNVSLEETSALIGALSDAGIKGSLAGTTIKNILLNLLKPSDNVSAALEKMELKGKSVVEILKGLKDRGMTIIDFLDTFDKRAITGAELLANDEVVSKVKNLNLALIEQLITVKGVSSVIRTDTNTALKILVNNFNEVALSVADALGDRPSNLIEMLTGKVKELDTWVDNNHATIKKYGDMLSKVFTFLAGTGLETLKFVIESADELAIVFGLALGATTLKNASNLLKTVNLLGVASQKITFGAVVSNLNLAVQAAFLLKGSVDYIVGKLEDQLDAKVEHSKHTLSNLDAERKMLESIAKEYRNIQNYQNLKNSETSEGKTRAKPSLLGISLKDINSGEKYFTQDYDKLIKKSEARIRVLKDEADLWGVYNVKGVDSFEKANKRIETLLKARKHFLVESKPTKSSANKGDNDLNNLNNLAGNKKETDFLKMIDLNERYFKYLDEETKKLLDWNMGVTETFKELGEIDKELDAAYKELADIDKKEILDFKDASVDAFSSMFNLWDSLEDAKLNRTLERLEEEESAIKNKYNMEIEAAGRNTFKKQMLEMESAQKTEQLQKKMEKARKDAAAREKKLAIFSTTLNAFAASADVIAREPAGLWGKLAAGATILSTVLGLGASLAEVNLREGTKGIFEGDGNSTSDSILAKVSKGERVLSHSEIDSLGGNEQIQQAIDRNDNFVDRGKSVYIDTVIGTKQFVRDSLIPLIEKEMSR